MAVGPVKPRPSVIALLAWSAAGLLGGHQAAYLLVYRDPAVLAHVFADTGHGWLQVAPFLAAAALLTAIVVGFGGTSPIPSLRWRFSALALVQTSAFLLVEAGERLAHGGAAADPMSILDGRGWLVVAVGVGVQCITAALVALASEAVERIGHAARTRRARPRHRTNESVRPIDASSVLPHGRLWAVTCRPRAPPS